MMDTLCNNNLIGTGYLVNNRTFWTFSTYFPSVRTQLTFRTLEKDKLLGHLVLNFYLVHFYKVSISIKKINVTS